MAQENECLGVAYNADVLLDDIPETKEQMLCRIINAIAKRLGSKHDAAGLTDFTETEHAMMRNGIHPEYPVSNIDSWNGDSFQKFMHTQFGLKVPGSTELLHMAGTLDYEIPSGYQQLHVEKDDYARHGVAIPIPGTQHYLCIANYDERPRWERRLSHFKNRILSTLSGIPEDDALPLQVVVRRTLVEK